MRALGPATRISLSVITPLRCCPILIRADPLLVSAQHPAYVDEDSLDDPHEDDGEGPRNVHLIRLLPILRIVPCRVEDVVDQDGEQVDDERDEMCLYHFLVQHLFEHRCLLDGGLEPEDSPEHEEARDQLEDPDKVLEDMKSKIKVCDQFIQLLKTTGLYVLSIDAEGIVAVHERDEKVQK